MRNVGIFVAAILLAIFGTASTLHAQTGCAALYYGNVLTPAQWNQCFTAKQDLLGYVPLNTNGGYMAGAIGFTGTAPVLSSCGTSPSISGNNRGGTITTGTGSPTGCTLTFADGGWSATPKCIVSWRTRPATANYAPTATTLTLTQTGTSSAVIDYYCFPTQ